VNLDGGIHEIPLPPPARGRLWLCGKHAIGPDPDALMARVGADTVVCLGANVGLSIMNREDSPRLADVADAHSPRIGVRLAREGGRLAGIATGAIVPAALKRAAELGTCKTVVALLFGLIFGVALGPCTFGFMAPVLGVTFGLAPSAPVFAVVVLLLFGLGHCTVIGLAGFSSTWVQSWLDWQDGTPGAKWLRRACGLLVLFAGGWLLYSAR